MKVYNYDEHGFYTIATDAFPNPIQPGEFLIPANATSLKPPMENKNEIARFVDEQWTLFSMKEQIIKDAKDKEKEEEDIKAKSKEYTQEGINDLVIKIAVRLGLIEEGVSPIKDITK